MPNANIYAFQGLLNCQNSPDPLPLDVSSLLIRGSSLRTTSEILGLVLYTGHETKELLNISSARYK